MTDPSSHTGAGVTNPVSTAQVYDQSTTETEAARPERFNGSDPIKLREFLISCVIYFESKPSRFPTDWHRVQFAASFLSGDAILWWQSYILVQPPPPIRSDWALFSSELNDN